MMVDTPDPGSDAGLKTHYEGEIHPGGAKAATAPGRPRLLLSRTTGGRCATIARCPPSSNRSPECRHWRCRALALAHPLPAL